jgi:hypothetical protein
MSCVAWAWTWASAQGSRTGCAFVIYNVHALQAKTKRNSSGQPLAVMCAPYDQLSTVQHVQLADYLAQW